MKKSLGDTEQLIAYIIQNLSGKITKTQLVKLMFLADIESYKFTGTPISDIRWKCHIYGPYDEKLDSRLNLLEKSDLIKVEKKSKRAKEDEIYFLYQFTGGYIDTNFDAIKKEIINTIIDQFGSFTLDSLLKYVYNTEPMKRVKKGEYIELKNFIQPDVKEEK